MFNYRTKISQAFTLIGLLISLGIIAIVAVVAVPAYTAYIDKTKTQTLLEEATVEQANILSQFIDEGSLDNINYVSTTPSGETITVTAGEIKMDTTVGGKAVQIYLTAAVNPATNTIGWECSASDPDANLPKECRQDATTKSVDLTAGYDAACTGGQLFINGSCACPAGSTLVFGNCQCDVINGFIDINGTCQCPIGKTLSGGSCVTIVDASISNENDPGACLSEQRLVGSICICNNSNEPAAIDGSCLCPFNKPCLDNGVCRVRYAGENENSENCSCSSNNGKQEIDPNSPSCRCKPGRGLINEPTLGGNADSCECDNSGVNPAAIWNNSTCVNCATKTINARPKYDGIGDADSNCKTCYAVDQSKPFWNGSDCVVCPAKSSSNGLNDCICVTGTTNEEAVATPGVDCVCADATPVWNGTSCEAISCASGEIVIDGSCVCAGEPYVAPSDPPDQSSDPCTRFQTCIGAYDESTNTCDVGGSSYGMTVCPSYKPHRSIQAVDWYGSIIHYVWCCNNASDWNLCGAPPSCGNGEILIDGSCVCAGEPYIAPSDPPDQISDPCTMYQNCGGAYDESTNTCDVGGSSYGMMICPSYKPHRSIQAVDWYGSIIHFVWCCNNTSDWNLCGAPPSCGNGEILIDGSCVCAGEPYIAPSDPPDQISDPCTMYQNCGGAYDESTNTCDVGGSSYGMMICPSYKPHRSIQAVDWYGSIIHFVWCCNNASDWNLCGAPH